MRRRDRQIDVADGPIGRIAPPLEPEADAADMLVLSDKDGRSEGSGACRHLVVERQEIGTNALRNRNVHPAGLEQVHTVRDGLSAHIRAAQGGGGDEHDH